VTEKLDANAEFAEKSDAESVVAKAAAAAEKADADKADYESTKAEVADLKEKYAESLKAIDGLKGTTATLGKIKEIFTGKSEDPREEYIKQEIRRRVPELNDVAQIKQLLPQLFAALNQEAQERRTERAESATEIVTELMKDANLDTDDQETIDDVEVMVAERIKKDDELVQAWRRGNVRSAVTKAFGKIQAKLLAPGRVGAKRGAVRSVLDSPKASPRGGAASSAPAAHKLDLKDTSRGNVSKIHDAAFERMQELDN